MTKGFYVSRKTSEIMGQVNWSVRIIRFHRSTLRDLGRRVLDALVITLIFRMQLHFDLLSQAGVVALD